MANAPAARRATAAGLPGGTIWSKMRAGLSTGDDFVGVPVMAWVRCVAVIAIGVLVITSPARAGGLSLDKTGTAASGPIGLETTIPLAKSKDTDQSQTSIDSATSDLEFLACRHQSTHRTGHHLRRERLGGRAGDERQPLIGRDKVPTNIFSSRTNSSPEHMPGRSNLFYKSRRCGRTGALRSNMLEPGHVLSSRVI